MPRNRTSSTSASVKTYTVPKASKGATIGKLKIPLVPLAEFGDTVSKVLELAQKDGIKPVSVKGVLTLY